MDPPRIALLPLALLFLHCAAPDESQRDAGRVDGAGPLVDASEGAGWSAMAAVGGGPIQETGVAALEGKVYVVGGFDETLQIGARLQVYDPQTDSWSLAAPLPIAAHHANVAAANGKLYVLGAMQLSGFSFVAIGNSYVYDPQTDSWDSIAPMPAGSECGSAAVGVFEDKIVLAGGLRSSALRQVVAYDLDADSWDLSLPQLPEPNDHLVGASVGGTMFAIGGRNGSIGSIKSTVLSYAPGDDAWQERAPMPTARGGAAAAVVQGSIVVVGGEGNSEDASGVFPEAEVYDPSSNSWAGLPDMPIPRHGMGAAGIGDTLYVPGGATKQGFGATATSESYRFE